MHSLILHLVMRDCPVNRDNIGLNTLTQISYSFKIGYQSWKWGGCSDNVRFGEMVSRLVMDTLDGGADVKAQVNLHNNNVGRLVSEGILM